MGVDYGSAAGFAIDFKEGEIERVINPVMIGEEENPDYDEDYSEADWVDDIEESGIASSHYGNHFSGRGMGFLLYPTDLPEDLETFLKDGKEIYTKFLENLNKYGFNKTFDDLKFYEKPIVW